MLRRVRTWLIGTGLALGAAAARADQAPPASAYPSCRSPYLLEVSPLAKPGRTPAYVGYYVGGGSPCHHNGDARLPGEGTWGWDYSGSCLHRRVWLDWFHGRRYQGGTGSYRTDGSELLRSLHHED
jgi:hypothetical protein